MLAVPSANSELGIDKYIKVNYKTHFLTHFSPSVWQIPRKDIYKQVQQ